VACWLTENITSALLKDNSVKSITYSIKIFEKFMNAILMFYSQANAPGLLKSVTLRLISRLVIKLRHLLHELDEAQATPAELEAKTHLEKLFITKDFINNLLTDAKTLMVVEEEDLSNQNRANLLYPAIV